MICQKGGNVVGRGWREESQCGYPQPGKSHPLDPQGRDGTLPSQRGFWEEGPGQRGKKTRLVISGVEALPTPPKREDREITLLKRFPQISGLDMPEGS